jgi:rod shape-determining protein MreB
VSEPLKAACRSVVEPIVQAVRGLIGRFDPEFQQRLRSNIILGGGGSQLRGLDRLLEDSLKDYGGAKVTRVSDPTYAGAVGALKLAMGMPREGWIQLKAQSAGTTPAMSMAAA